MTDKTSEPKIKKKIIREMAETDSEILHKQW